MVGWVWGVFGGLCGGWVGVGGFGGLLLVWGLSIDGLAMVGTGLAAAGLAIFAFFGCLAATKGTANMTQKIVLSIKKRFVGKEKE